ncbi:uncharacterized protein LOC122650356 [Telopea speciosissima]|uniref:uncharacterized protein LOC122650356 n=1 Tax=Telopea speciosissima TaxID=54955 RepID=UPI001CC53AFD|nr:uncharacterized protein LOC122650356 [Telopea speciosissima]
MLTVSNQHPFVKGIMEAELLKGFKILAFMLYDGYTDPIDHINYFNSVMMVYNGSDTASCSIRQKKTVANLLAIKQWRDESIRDFVSRFNRELLDILDLDDLVAFNALQSGITDMELIKSLILNKAHNMTDLISRCHQFANMAKIIAARNEVEGKGLLNWPAPMFSKPEDRNPQKYCHFHRDTGHNTEDCRQLKSEIENLIQDGHLSKYVDRRKESRPDHKEEEQDHKDDRRDQQRDDRRHDKEKMTEKRSEPTREAGQSSRPLVAPILMILGGPGQESVRKAKAHARFIGVAEATNMVAKSDPIISFTNEDMEGISWSHDDAIVLQMIIQDRIVHRI